MSFSSSPLLKRNSSVDLQREEGGNLKEIFFMMEIATEEELEKGDEDNVLKEKLMYFYPESMSLNEQLYFVGVVQTYLTFAEKFEPTNEKVSMIKFTNCKISIMTVSDIIVVLCGPNHVPDEGLKRNLDRIIESITFFNGPIELTKKRISERQEYLDYIKQVGIETSLLVKTFNHPFPTPSSIFEPLPYLELPLNSNSLFSLSNSFLDSLFEYEGYLGGVVFYDEHILSTQLSEDIVNWILYRQNLLKDFKKRNKKKSSLLDQPTLSSSLPNLNRYKEMSDDETEISTLSIEDQLSDEETDLNFEEFNLEFSAQSKLYNRKTDVIPVYLTSKQAKQYPTMNEKEYQIGNDTIEKPKDGEFYVLMMYYSENTFVGILMDIRQMKNSKLMNDLKNDISSQIKGLSSKVRSAFINKQQSKYVVKSKVSFLRQPGVSSSVLIYDHINKKATGFYNHKSRFLHQVSVAHESFQSSKDVKKIILRNNVGYLYSSKVYETEIFYHHPFNHKKGNFIELSGLDSLERTVRENILKDFDIYLL